MKTKRIVLTIVSALTVVTLVSAQTQTQATLNSNPRQTPYTVPATETAKAAAPRSERNGDASVFSVGEKVTICRDSIRYMTGEKISTWVYEAEHTVRQVNSKHHPNGILLVGINSWVYPGSLEKEVVQTESQPLPTPSSERGSAEPVQEQNTAQEQVKGQEPQQASQETVQTEVPAQKEEPVQVSAQEQQPATPTTEYEQVAEATETTQTPQSTQSTEATEATENTKTTGKTEVVSSKPTMHRFTVGLRGGYANNMSKATDAKHPFGYDAMLDLQYAHYWAKSEDKCQLGLLVGIGAGYLQSGLQQALNEQFIANTTDGNIHYTVTADEVKDKTGQVQLEVPVMFSMITPKGFFLNAGPRILLPVYTPSHQTVTNPNVDAYFEEEGVHVVNEAVTGVVTDAQQDIKATTANNLKVNILLGAELGYEFRLQSGHSIGLGAYANYGLWSAFKGNGDGKVFNLTAPDGAKTAVIDIETLTNAKATKMGYLDAGVKLTFNMNWRK